MREPFPVAARICISVVLVAVIGWPGTLPSSAHAHPFPHSHTPAPLHSPPPPHLGYGLNVRDPDVVESLFSPLGFEWLKLWEEYGTQESPTLPQARYPYKVLFLIDCTRRSGDLEDWGQAVEAIAVAGQGLVEAYEICNEPNRAGWLNYGVSSAPPDPALYVRMLQIAYGRIKAVDPAAIVVSAGLAPVGRVRGTCNGWSGSNCDAMDEREYARQMFLLGAGDCFDAFGYHPYGFAYEPERALDELPAEDDGNGFAFRGVEVMHDLLEQHGLGYKPVWATEFNWLRDPNDDGGTPGWCHRIEEYETPFGWMDVPEVQQAEYLTRAFQYADEHWPWMGAMFVWNLDWYDYGWLCDPARYFSVLKIDYAGSGWVPCLGQGIPAEAGRPPYRAYPGERVADVALSLALSPYTTTLAYDALAAMEKRPGEFGPRLMVVPPALTFLAGVDEPGLLTGVVVPRNVGYGVFTWTATVAGGMQVTPTLAITTGLQGSPLTVTVDSTGYTTGTFTGLISMTAQVSTPGMTLPISTSRVLDAPQVVEVTLHVVPELYRVYVPLVLRSAP